MGLEAAVLPKPEREKVGRAAHGKDRSNYVLSSRFSVCHRFKQNNVPSILR